MYHLDINDDELVREIVSVAFPEYKGRRVRIEYGVKKINMRSYWDGGSKFYFSVVNVQNRKALRVPTSHPIFDKVKGVDAFEIPEGYVVVEHSIFCGKDQGIYIHSPDSAPLLEAGEEDDLQDIDIHVLQATRGLKSSYAGIRDRRAYELKRKYGYTKEQIEQSRARLREGKYLNKRNAITNKGRNRIENLPGRISF